MGDGVTLGLTTYSGGLPINLSGFHGYRYEDFDERSHIDASCQALGIGMSAWISATADCSLQEIWVGAPAYYSTVSGIAVGDGEEDIIAAYENNLRRIEGEYNSQGVGHYDLRYVYVPEGDAKITFYLYEGAIYLIVMERDRIEE